MLSAVREVQVPLLAALLLCACAAKAWRVARELITGRGTAGTRPGEGNPGIMDRALGPTALFPAELRRPAAIFMCASELLLGAGLILTATRVGARVPATAVRVGVAVFFLIALGALIELRERRPDVGCGCFGDLSASPVGMRVIARTALLAVAAIATVGEPALRLPPSAAGAELRIAIGAAELIVLAALSPELGEALVRLGYSEPCELRRIPVARTLGALTGSAQWRRYAGMIVSASPADVWREGCWRYAVYPGRENGRQVEIVFAVFLRAHRPQVRAAVLDAVTGEVLTRTSPPSAPGHAAPAPALASRRLAA